ncbi:hypothetical protein HU718_004780 [Pseudomonas tensinigenes]|uniref:Uncharacterized protein n=1 Tax=Pseudomonas tensinigenes TaxID=2745511 RepID=A0ABX8Q017_9PSED|nr:hypothetical protein [Pseudomonas tensinigenes]QXI07014.1 hypothetical protein HU718_004780 [Pseudomonas tensinigenes]
MRDLIKVNLQAWINRLETQDSSEIDEEYEFFLDYKLLGVATFLKQIAYEQDDLELLAISSKVEMQVLRMLQDEEKADHEREEIEEQAYELDRKVREVCIQHFYTEPAFSVDMSKYEEMITVSAESFSDPYKLSSLKKYVDAQQVLTKIYEKVKNRLWRASSIHGLVPTLKDVSEAFDVELHEIYRLADIHVSRVVTQYAKAPA